MLVNLIHFLMVLSNNRVVNMDKVKYCMMVALLIFFNVTLSFG
jgi:hypothetical protein